MPRGIFSPIEGADKEREQKERGAQRTMKPDEGQNNAGNQFSPAAVLLVVCQRLREVERGEWERAAKLGRVGRDDDRVRK